MITFSEWGELVKTVLPTLERASQDYGLFLNLEAADRLLDEGEYLTVYHMIKGVCDGLEAIPEASMAHSEACLVVHEYPHESAH